MTQSEIFAARLKNARIMKGFSQDDLVSAMGIEISKMSISKYENNKMSPSSSVIISLANALNQPIDYFFRPFTLQIESIKFRKKSRLSVNPEKMIKEKILDLIERYIDIEEICNVSNIFSPPLKDKISNSNQVKKAASELRKIWNIGVDGIVNVIDLLEEQGIRILEIDAPEFFDGLSSMVNDIYPVIVLNKSLSSERKRFTALHELGHIILSFESDIAEKEEEKLCHIFASEMLILEPVFVKLIGSSRHDISYQELRAIQLQYGISCDALMYKAKECGIISQQRYIYYCIKKNKNQNFKQIVEKSLYYDEESNRFTRLVYKALSNELISISKAANLLHQSVEQVRGDLVLV